MSAEEMPDVPIRVFISYARRDDEQFNFIQPFKEKLDALVTIKSGRSLSIFVDRHDIGWGEDWRARIADSVEAAVIFIPMVTAVYLSRPNCREEFIAFHSKASAVGVAELLLPVLPFSTVVVSPSSTDEIARIVESRQYKILEDGILNGYSSPQWMSRMAEIADSLIHAWTRASEKIAEQAGVVGDPDDSIADSVPGGESPDENEDDDTDLLELTSKLQVCAENMTEAAQALAADIEQLNLEAQSVSALKGTPSPKEAQVWTLTMARALQGPSAGIGKNGLRLYDVTRKMDIALVKLQQLALAANNEQIEGMITSGLRHLTEQFTSLDGVQAQLEGLLDSMKPAEMLSAPLRKSLRPARDGLTAVVDSLNLIAGWTNTYV